MLYGLVGLLAVVAVAIGLYFIALKPAVEKQVQRQDPQHRLVEGERFAEDRSIYERSGGANFLVPDNRIPSSQKERYDAAAITLLSDRWQEDPNPEIGPGADAAPIPANERKALTDSAQQFIKLWETFEPPAVRSEFDVKPAAYISKLSPWVAPENLDDVVQREDNSQPDHICPWNGCLTSSTWEQGDASAGSNVRYYDGEQAYLTTFAGVRYNSVSGTDQLDGSLWLRSYGLLMRRSGDRWLVTRAAASSRDLLR